MTGTINDVNLIVFRHGETIWNAMNGKLVGGRSNWVPLSTEGRRQARQLGRDLGRQGLRPDKIFVSPAERTLVTARLALAEAGLLDMPIHVEDALQEMTHGREIDGQPREKIYTDPIKGDIARLGKDFKFPNGQSMNDIGKISTHWAGNLPAQLRADGTIPTYWAIGHDIWTQCLASEINGWTHAQTREAIINNASANIFTRRSGQLAVSGLNIPAAQLSAHLARL